MATYVWTGSGWLDAETGKTSTATPEPGPGNTLLIPAGSTLDTVLSPGNLAGGPTKAYGNIIIGAHANVDFGTFSSADTASYDHFAVDNLFVGADSTLSLRGSIEGRPATETMQATNVFLAHGSTLDLGVTPEVGPDRIGSLINNGGTLHAPSNPSAEPNKIALELGGPGFVQTSGFTTGESELNDGHGDTVANLGNITKGSVAAAIDEMITNAPPGGTFGFVSLDGGFSFTQQGNAARLDVNTQQAGTHVALLTYTQGNVHDLLVIADRVA